MTEKQQTESRPSSAHPTSEEMGGVWLAVSEFMGSTPGFLVSDAKNVHRPIAFVIDGDYPIASEQAIDVAWNIACDPDSALWRHCIDLRQYGYPDSRAPMPGGLYGMLCTPVDEQNRPVGDELRFEPFCPFHLRRQQQEAVRIGGWTRATLPPVRSPDDSLYEELSSWHDVASGIDPNHPLVAKLDAATENMAGNDEHFDFNASMARRVRNEFIMHPDAGKLLNCWKPSETGVNPEQQDHFYFGRMFVHSLVVTADRKHRILANLQYESIETFQPLAIRILEGARLKDVTTAIDQAKAYLEKHWVSLILGYDVPREA